MSNNAYHEVWQSLRQEVQELRIMVIKLSNSVSHQRETSSDKSVKKENVCENSKVESPTVEDISEKVDSNIAASSKSNNNCGITANQKD